MAVTQDADGNSKKSVEEPAQQCSREGANPGPPTRLTGTRKDNGGTVRIGKRRGINDITKIRSNGLSDLDDIEFVGYLNTKEEIHRKRILWEAMNENYMKVKKRKRAAETKKVDYAKKATKTTNKVEPERRSSRINYDALKSLGGDMHEERCEPAQTSAAASYAQQDISYEDETHYEYGDEGDEDFYDDFDF